MTQISHDFSTHVLFRNRYGRAVAPEQVHKPVVFFFWKEATLPLNSLSGSAALLLAEEEQSNLIAEQKVATCGRIHK